MYTSYTMHAKCEYHLDFFEQTLSGALEIAQTVTASQWARGKGVADCDGFKFGIGTKQTFIQ